MKKLSTLLARRDAVLRQAHLANLAFAYATLSEFAQRIARAQLTGEVSLKHASPTAERYWASLTAMDGRQSLIEEHFSDQDLMDLADVVAFATGRDAVDVTFRLEDLMDEFVLPLRVELEAEGVVIDRALTELEERR